MGKVRNENIKEVILQFAERGQLNWWKCWWKQDEQRKSIQEDLASKNTDEEKEEKTERNLI